MHYVNGQYMHLFAICILNDVVYFIKVKKMSLYFLSKYFKIRYFFYFQDTQKHFL